MYNQVLNKLSHSYKWRERRMKNAMIAEMLIEKYQLPITKEILETIIVEAASLDRYWRDVALHNPALRGADYSDGKTLAQEKKLALGYQPMHHEISKKVQEL